MAEGGEFGIEQPELDKQLDNNSKDAEDDVYVYDDDAQQEIDTNRLFPPSAQSTPYHDGEQIEMQTRQHEKSGLAETSFDEIPSVWDLTDDKEPLLAKKQREIDNAENRIKSFYPKAKINLLGRLGLSQKDGKSMVSFGPKEGEIKIFRDNGRGLLKSFTDRYKKELGPMAQEAIEKDNEELRNDRQRLREAEKQLKESEKLASEREKAAKEVQDLRIRIERTQAQIDAHTQEQGTNVESESELRRLQQLKKNLQTDFENAKKEVSALQKKAKTKDKEQKSVDQLRAKIAAKERERNTMEARLNDTRTLDELKEQEAELQRQNEEDQAVIDDENTSPSDKQAAEGRVAERQEELARLQTQIDERERALPLRERVKEIFKKYGVTVTAIVLAAGVTIGAVIGAITNALRATGKALGKGLKDIGSKLASILPGLIGSIVSFLFKAAGQAIGFLAEHTWLIILAVVAFLVEKYIKKRR